MKAVFLDFGTVGSDATLDVGPLRDVTADLTLYDYTTAGQAVERITGCDFVFVNKVRMTRDVIDAADRLKFIGLLATGVDNVDLDAARERGIAVCNIRAYCTHSVVEHVFAVLLQLSHSTQQYAKSVRDGEWQRATNFCMLQYPIRELSAMTIGIVGYGNLGRGVAKIARAFGMQVMISRRPGTAGEEDDGRSDFEDVLRQCDVLTLHCPLTGDTEGLIGEGELAAMKPTAILINTARGGLVDSAALVEALENRQIAAAAIDVLRTEPPVDGDPLLDYRGGNLIVTPHIAWATVEARQNAIDQLAATARSFLDGGDLNRVV
jgi:glycerate dehydrogenase